MNSIKLAGRPSSHEPSGYVKVHVDGDVACEPGTALVELWRGETGVSVRLSAESFEALCAWFRALPR